MSELLHIDGPRFEENFAKTPFGVTHSLSGHELLGVESIARLADALPESSVEHNRGDIPAVVGDGEAPRLDLTPGEIARTVESNKSWMVLKNIEQDAEYRRLLDGLLDEVAPLVSGREGGMNLREGFIFLSAPNSVTPAHTDHEHNFLLQIRAPKYFHVGRFNDARAGQIQIERMYAGARNLDRLPDDPQLFELGPGDGVYVPPTAPHWVETGDDVSVSLSITFRTPATENASYVHAVNRHLRRAHLSPRPPGRSRVSDQAKAGVFRTLQRVRGG